jgi:general secretion pathway protein I
MNSTSRAAGFTLLEVLIALAVLALALAAVISTAGSSTRAAASLRDKTFAHWVAMNQVTQARLAKKWPDTGSSNGDSDMAGRGWHWEMTVSKTGDKYLRRIDIDVFTDSDDKRPVTSLTAFVAQPLTQSGAPADAKRNSGAQSEPGLQSMPSSLGLPSSLGPPI